MKYKPHIDGLRALAVVPVVLFHAKVPAFDGGFVGVDVFFVISGFLITSIIQNEISCGAFSFVSFYERRARRILPALFAVIVICMIVGLFTLPPSGLKTLSISSLSAALFGSNFYFWLEPGDYFAEAPWRKPLLHTWSLGVEEQFYIFFPLTLVAARKFAGAALKAVIALLLVSSLIVSIWGAFAKPSATFFLLPARMWELMIGALIATSLPNIHLIHSQVLRNLLALTGLGLIVLSILLYDSTTVFPGAAALVPCAGAAILIISGYENRNDKPYVVRVLEWRPVVWLGLISYPLYLWHWPLLAFATHFKYGQLNSEAAAFALAASFACASLTWRFIESPIRARRALASRRSIFLAASFSAALICSISIAGWASDGIPQRIKKELRAAAAQNEHMRTEWTYPCDNFRRDLTDQNPLHYCIIGTAKENGVFFWGDSYTEQIFPEMNRLVNDGMKAQLVHLVFATSGGCLPLLALERNERDFHCNQFNTAALSRALQPDVEKVVISGFWTDFFPDQDFSAHTYNFVEVINGRRYSFPDDKAILAFFSKELSREVKILRAAGKRVVVVMPYPTFSVSPPEYIWWRLFLGKEPEMLLSRDRYMAEKEKFRGIINRVAGETGSEVADPAALLCQWECEYRDGNVSFYKDTNHLVPRGVRRIDKMLVELIED